MRAVCPNICSVHRSFAGRRRSFFDLQAVVTEPAWTMSAGGDEARMDAVDGVDVPDDIAHQRWTLEQVAQATRVDQSIADAFGDVIFMLAHPSTLTDPGLVERAIAVNQIRPA